jgi:hypothetical protein
MVLPTSGAISLNEIHVEAGGTTGTTASINDADIRGLISKADGATMSFSEWYGAGAPQEITLSVVSTNQANEATSLSISGAQAGDLLIAFMGRAEGDLDTTPTFSNTFGSSITSLYSVSKVYGFIYDKGVTAYINASMNIGYKILTGAETSWSIGESGSRGCAHILYRPSSTIRSVTSGDKESINGYRSIEGAQAGSTFIAVGTSMRLNSTSINSTTWYVFPTDFKSFVSNNHSLGSSGYRFETYHDDTEPFNSVGFNTNAPSEDYYGSASLWIGVG